jgi:hypothetical protein
MYFTSPIFGRRVFNLGLNHFLRADIKGKDAFRMFGSDTKDHA